MSDGLGMRYAFLGALETAHLNAEGMANYCERYNKSIYDVIIHEHYDSKQLWFQSRLININMFCSVGKHDNGWNATHDWTSGWGDFETIERNHPIGQIGRTTCLARRMPHKVEPIEKKYLNALLCSRSMYFFCNGLMNWKYFNINEDSVGETDEWWLFWIFPIFLICYQILWIIHSWSFLSYCLDRTNLDQHFNPSCRNQMISQRLRRRTYERRMDDWAKSNFRIIFSL